MENSIIMDDDWGYPYSRKSSISISLYIRVYNIYIYTRDDMNLNEHTYMSNVQNVADIPIKGGHQSITRVTHLISLVIYPILYLHDIHIFTHHITFRVLLVQPCFYRLCLKIMYPNHHFTEFLEPFFVALPHFHAQSCPGIPGVDRPHQQTHGAPCGGTTTGGWNPLDDREMYRTPLYFVGNTHGNTIGFL